MHKLTEIEIAEKRRQYSKEREEELNKIVESAVNLKSGHTAIRYLKTGFKYIDNILNAAYSVETGALMKSKTTQPEQYFVNLKDELFHLLEEESRIVQSKALAQFRSMGDGIQKAIVAESGQEIAERRGSILNHTERIKEQLKLELAQEAISKKDPLVFISYDTRDIELADVIAAILKRIFADRVKTFIAKRDIEPGDNAFKTMLHDNLARSAVVLAICTNRSLTSPWLWFESGAGFGNCTLIPIWAGIKPEEFKAPMTIFQGINIENREDIQNIISKISDIVRLDALDTHLTREEFDKLQQITHGLKRGIE